MRAIWKGTISFGLVSIPVSLYPAIRREDLHFRLLRGADHSVVNYKRVAENDGKEVPWDKIVKGYEYEKGKFVIIKDEDFRRVDVEATQTVDIINFVALEEVNPLLFYKPYHLEVAKGGGKAYILLRDALEKSGKIAIARVVIKTRQHLAAIKPQGKNLVLELMHFPDELRDMSELKAPEGSAPAKAEINMAQKLIESMTTPWNPEEYKDEYREALEEMIEDKVANGDSKPVKAAKTKRPTNVIDLVAVLQESLKKSGSRPASTSSTKTEKKPAAKSTRTTKSSSTAKAAKKSAPAKKSKSRRKAA
ncbi:DNA end-binding protein Ku [Prosthecobacter fusiformis]|uniref:Non-homologous end joining protein Ku n=1 Tax=Prosthecobacter fusiformis TaxID=48464 RepID=A0A4R7SQV3_9BACT|nr:Ku protein [Prosthecobacter fusiformis]TDU81304.1 DNA end-binding protein Ku [Prosthecobacter fusiformis]